MLVAAAIFGAILGSFLNALSFRYNTGRSVLRGRSKCLRCGHTLLWLDLIPVFSWLILAGRCRYCGAKISWQYPLVECAAAALSAGVYVLHPEPALYALGTALWMTLLFLFVYDLRHSVLPLPALALAAVLALLQVWIAGFDVWHLLAGPILAAPLLLISLVSAGRWMGWGDGILQLSLGWAVGLTAGFSALCIAFWSGACVGIALLYVAKGITMKSEVPFAPFLIVGAGVAYFFHVDFFQALPLLFS